MNTKKREITYINPALLKENHEQAHQRLTDTALAGLVAKIKSTGEIEPIAVDERDGLTILNGHRRRAAAIKLGISLVPIYKSSAKFGDLNSGNRAYSGAMWLTSWAKAKTKGERAHILKSMSNNAAKHIARLIAILGEDRVVELGLIGKVNPTIVSAVSKLCQMFTDYGISYNIAQVTEWVAAAPSAQGRINRTNHNTGNKKRQLNTIYREITVPKKGKK